jgi:hypothetical protein
MDAARRNPARKAYGPALTFIICLPYTDRPREGHAEPNAQEISCLRFMALTRSLRKSLPYVLPVVRSVIGIVTGKPCMDYARSMG